MRVILSNITLGILLRFLGVSLLVIGIVGYVEFQARNLIHGPSITLTEEPPLVERDRTVTLRGEAENIVKLTLNGREIHTNEAGEFAQDLILENGLTIVTLAAKDRFGRTTTLTERYVYDPES
ncbi:MAG TPA: hypothetical protein VFS75_01890 [Candidatus Paceibacterota bacterium]|nr:hypothetical protein [Candidatus Paceibacterota bacterium]